MCSNKHRLSLVNIRRRAEEVGDTIDGVVGVVREGVVDMTGTMISAFEDVGVAEVGASSAE